MVKRTESLTEFYKHKFDGLAEELKMDLGHFNVFRIEDWLQAGASSPSYVRRDFYKIMLFQGNGIFHYGDKSIHVQGNTLLFFNPQVPYTSDPLAPDTRGYYCIFNDQFFSINHRLHLNEIALFKPRAQPVFALSDEQCHEIKVMFEKMIRETGSDYMYRYELVRNYVSELIYTALKLDPSVQQVQLPDAGSRIVAVFLELLERQFPITTPSQRFAFRSPKVIADRLAVHVNSLNRAVKKTTGRTTTDLVSERLISEAKALLRHTDWNIAEISDVLGFETQAQFNTFFKKYTKLNPTSFRQVSI